MKPQAQVVGFWLIEQADADGIVDGVDWQRLAEDTGITVTTLRKELKEGQLILSGKVEREPRRWGNTFGATRYILHIDEQKGDST